MAELKQLCVARQIRQLTRTPAAEPYNDVYNRLVCERLDLLLIEGVIIPDTISKLAYADSKVRQELLEGITDDELITFLSQRKEEQQLNQLKQGLKRNTQILGNEQLSINLTIINYILNNKQKEPVWNNGKLQTNLISGLKGGMVELVAVLCCINNYDYKGGYWLEKNLDAYKTNPKLPNVPGLLDQLIKIKQMLGFYDIKCQLNLYIADTEYTEVDKFGPVTADVLTTIQAYIDNIGEYCQKEAGVSICSISQLTATQPVYQVTKAKILELIIKWEDVTFRNKWYQPFERYAEEMFDRIEKRKIFPAEERRRRSIKITRSRWAVNAAEGAVWSQLCEKSSLIFLSTESRKKDFIYAAGVRKESDLPTILYLI